MADEKISAMTALPNPPSVAGAKVPVVQPGDTTNYQAPIARLLTGAPGTSAPTGGESINITAGDNGPVEGAGTGDVNISAGSHDATVGSSGGSVVITAAGGNLAGFSGGKVGIYGADGSNGGTGAFIDIAAGNGGADDVNAASVHITGGAATSGNANSGDVALFLSAGTGTGRSGLVIISGLVTADPHVAAALWSNAGVLTVSAG